MNRSILIGILGCLWDDRVRLDELKFYTVSEVEQVIITQFGRPVGEPVTTAGLKFKTPFIQDVNPIDKRILEWDGSPSDMPTKDKLYIAVDLFALDGGSTIRSNISFGCVMNAAPSLDWTTFSAARPVTLAAKHELIEIIRTTKDRVPLRDAQLTHTESDVGALVPIQGAQLSSRRFSQRLPKRLRCSALNCSTSGSGGSTITRACGPRSTIE